MNSRTAAERLRSSLANKYPEVTFTVINAEQNDWPTDPQGIPEWIVLVEYEGMAIVDPFTSECGRFAVSPEVYGIRVEDAAAIKAHNKISIG